MKVINQKVFLKIKRWWKPLTNLDKELSISQLALEDYYLKEKEKQKTKRLADALQRNQIAKEQQLCWQKLQEDLQAWAPEFDQTVIEKGSYSDKFESILQAIAKNQLPSLDNTQKETIVRIAEYGHMVTAFPQEMAQTQYGEFFYSIYEKCRHSKILARHLYPLVDNLQTEINVYCSIALKEFIKAALSEKGVQQASKMADDELFAFVGALSKKERQELADSQNWQVYVQKLSLDLASIMAKALRLTVKEMQQAVMNPEYRFEAVDFNIDIGLVNLQKKLFALTESAKKIEEPSLKKQLLALLKL